MALLSALMKGHFSELPSFFSLHYLMFFFPASLLIYAAAPKSWKKYVLLLLSPGFFFLISGGLDSPVAAWMMARRGVELTAIHFASPPYTSERAHEKVVSLLKKVGEYAGRMEMVTVPFTKIQEEIRDNCPEDRYADGGFPPPE